MPMKGGSPELREIDRWDGGVGWLAYPGEGMQRASHALVDGDDVWVFDPVDAPGVDDLLAEFGDVAGVAVCLDRHKRDAAAIARRHDVAVHVPERATGVATKLDAPIERFGATLADTPFECFTVKDTSLPPWHEVALYDRGERTLYVPEALGTASYFLARGERLGVHPMLRLLPPKRVFEGVVPERILVGHGEGVLSDGGVALREALDGARSGAPSAYARALSELI
jgi:hypothetical protein